MHALMVGMFARLEQRASTRQRKVEEGHHTGSMLSQTESVISSCDDITHREFEFVMVEIYS